MNIDKEMNASKIRQLAEEIDTLSKETNGATWERSEHLKLKIAARGVDLARGILDGLNASPVKPCVAALVTDDRGRLLLVRTKRGWELPGGRLEGGETWRQALVRELREETGLCVVLDPGDPRVFDGMPVNGAQYQSIILIGRGTAAADEPPGPQKGDAVAEARWFDEVPVSELSRIATAQIVLEYAAGSGHRRGSPEPFSVSRG